MILPDLLDLLCCPITRQALRKASSEELENANRLRFGNQSPGTPTPPFEEGLVSEDGQRLYPIWDGIPCLIASEAVSLGTSAE